MARRLLRCAAIERWRLEKDERSSHPAGAGWTIAVIPAEDRFESWRRLLAGRTYRYAGDDQQVEEGFAC